MEPAVLLLCSKELGAGPCPETDDYSLQPHTIILKKIHFNINLPSSSLFPKWSFLFQFFQLIYENF
jgi:hypothetical protein